MAGCPTPKSIAAATKLLEEYADLDGRIALLEEDRSADIAAANQRADIAAAPMIKRRDDITAIVEPWWPFAFAADVSKGKKSMQLGGCLLGVRKSKDKLAHDFESDDKAALALFKTRFRRHTTRLKVALDRMATLKLLQLGGKTGAAVAELGFKIEPGTDQFFVERVQQERTIGS
jgi:hypothetical protein